MEEEKVTFDYEKNSVQEFTVQFLGGYVRIDDAVLPVGQVSAEILALPPETMEALMDAGLNFREFLTGKFVAPETKKDGTLAKELQEHTNAMLDVLLKIPPYSYMQMDEELARTVWANIYKADPEDWAAMFRLGTSANIAFRNYINSMMNAFFEAGEFRAKAHAMLEVYFEPLQKRSAAAYARAAHEFIEAGRMLDDLDELTKGRSLFKLQQTRRAMVEYTPMPNPDAPEEYVIAERMVFHSIAEFLHMDLFRALINGNAPRCCHNCGTYFLLTKGYNTCYCNNIAPGETERTCRKVGAHKKEAAKEGESPIALEYRRVYRKLIARKNRGKISAAEWNEAVGKALGYKDMAERGGIGELELREIYKGM